MICCTCGSVMTHNEDWSVHACTDTEGCGQQYLSVSGQWRIPTIHSTIKKNRLGEYVVRFHIDGVFHDEHTYFTDDKKDAENTRDDIIKRMRVLLRRW